MKSSPNPSFPSAWVISVETAKQCDCEKINLDEKTFRSEMNEDACATDKLAEGIRRFAADTAKLETFLAEKLQIQTA